MSRPPRVAFQGEAGAFSQEAVRQLFSSFEASSMREIYEAIAYGYKRPRLQPQKEPGRAGENAADTS